MLSYTGLQGSRDALREQVLYKQERVLASRQGSMVVCDDGCWLINLGTKNHIGLS